MDRSEERAICKLLNRVEPSEGKDFEEALKEGRVEYCEVYAEGEGVLVIYKDGPEHIAVCSFQNVLKDYETLRRIEGVINGYLQKLGGNEMLCFVHSSEQIYLNNFVCKLNFEKPHYGYAYKLTRKDFVGGEDDLRGLEAREYGYDQADALFDLHSRAFREQTLRAGHPEGYDEEDIAYLMDLFGKPDAEKTLRTFYADGKLVGYTLFLGGYCDLIAVDPDCQSKGYGRAMLTYSVAKAFENPKIRSVSLHTFLINVKAQKLYESIGFKKVACRCLNNSKKADLLCFAMKAPSEGK